MSSKWYVNCFSILNSRISHISLALHFIAPSWRLAWLELTVEEKGGWNCNWVFCAGQLTKPMQCPAYFSNIFLPNCRQWSAVTILLSSAQTKYKYLSYRTFSVGRFGDQIFIHFLRITCLFTEQIQEKSAGRLTCKPAADSARPPLRRLPTSAWHSHNLALRQASEAQTTRSQKISKTFLVGIDKPAPRCGGVGVGGHLTPPVAVV